MASTNERRIAREIMNTVWKLNLPLKLDEITEGQGNCFPLAILAQCRRPEVFKELNRSIQAQVYQNDPTLLRLAVQSFMANSNHPTIQEYKRRYGEVLAVIDQANWNEYWDNMIGNNVWVDYIFIQSTAWYLNHDIIIVTTSSTENHPYLTISGNLDNENLPCPGVDLTIGSKSQIHYQSLLPLTVTVKKSPVKANIPEDTIKLKVALSSYERSYTSDMKKINDMPPNIDSRVEYPDLVNPKELKKNKQKDINTNAAQSKLLPKKQLKKNP